MRASDEAVAPFLEAAKKSTTILTRKAALKAQTQDKRQGKKVKRVKRADECKMTGRVLAKAPAPVIVHKLRGDEPNYEKMLQVCRAPLGDFYLLLNAYCTGRPR